MTDKFWSLTIALCATLLVVFSCEAVLWGMGYNPMIYYAGMPNHQYRHQTFEFDVSYTQNEFGFRSRNISFEKPKNIYRIVILGDSYTYGLGVRDDEVYSLLLETELNAYAKSHGLERKFEVVNLGISNRAIGDYLNYFQTVGVKYQPDMTLVAFFEGNDVTDEVSMVLSTDEVLEETSVYAVIRNATKSLIPRLFKLVKLAKKQWSQNQQTSFRHSETWTEEKLLSYLVSEGLDTMVVKKKLRDLPEAMLSDVLNNRIFRPAFVRWLSDGKKGVLPDANIQQQKENFTEDTFIRLTQTVRDQKSEFLLVSIPSPFSVVDRSRLLWTRSSPPDSTQERIRKFVRRMCEMHDVPYVDLRPVFIRANQIETITHFAYDLHWNAAGHRMVADTLFEYFKKSIVN